MKPDYDRARKDMEFLESIRELDDWVSIEDEMVNLMRNPTKEKAAELYSSAIGLWFQEVSMDGLQNPLEPSEERVLRRIAAHYQLKYDF